ncbi:hypothetical protein [Methylomonas methanica]|uniref:Uncharacterized protein n=1 Tax=Methylomonas methanica (strain DSM 25384 / MC09) TaxID=857087 RepID=F9ZW52_METMM|nr:hypothetical protein [Methylomonas methanica]AEG02023.1 hypothetical protein Metme_3662 [Methylomonas methanica MC09]
MTGPADIPISQASTSPESSEDSSDVLKRSFAGRRVAESLQQALVGGAFSESGDGYWVLAVGADEPQSQISRIRQLDVNCRGCLNVLFPYVYQRRYVPLACAECYKVKISIDTVRELVAFAELAETLPYDYKCGSEVQRRTSSDRYSAYFYCNGLKAARAVYRDVRSAAADNALLGAIRMTIKRGCSVYETSCGPSDRYQFYPEQAELESWLLPRLRDPAISVPDRRRVKMSWLEIAYRIGDDTYRDFTHGRSLYPATVSYDPDPAD